MQKSIEVEVAGEKYYAKFNEVQHLLDTWVEESDIVDLVSKEELDQILEKYRKWKQAYDEKKRKKAIAKQFEKEEEISQIGDCMIYNKPTYGDNFANVPASVSWSISHPF